MTRLPNIMNIGTCKYSIINYDTVFTGTTNTLVQYDLDKYKIIAMSVAD